MLVSIVRSIRSSIFTSTGYAERLKRPGLTVAALSAVFLASVAIYPLLGLAFFPQTDAGQFTINLKVPTGTRIENTEQYVAKVEDLIRSNVDKPRI